MGIEGKNMEKTKVMVFRRGGKIRREENFYHKGKALEFGNYIILQISRYLFLVLG